MATGNLKVLAAVGKAAGPASLLSWILAGSIPAALALVHAELGSTYPLSCGTARFPFLSFGVARAIASVEEELAAEQSELGTSREGGRNRSGARQPGREQCGHTSPA